MVEAPDAVSVTRIADSPPAVRGYVYFFHSPMIGLTKIGKSRNSDRRLGQIRTSLPDLELVHDIATGSPRELESYFHTCFAHRREHGEWFALGPWDLELIKVCPGYLAGRPLGGKYFKSSGMPDEIGELYSANWPRRWKRKSAETRDTVKLLIDVWNRTHNRLKFEAARQDLDMSELAQLVLDYSLGLMITGKTPPALQQAIDKHKKDRVSPTTRTDLTT